uniref:Uncharacterized protein n=1 Tax=Steinernema glaseri TaxID=37863 RepID=A0A1I7ZAX2_9BILA
MSDASANSTTNWGEENGPVWFKDIRGGLLSRAHLFCWISGCFNSRCMDKSPDTKIPSWAYLTTVSPCTRPFTDPSRAHQNTAHHQWNPFPSGSLLKDHNFANILLSRRQKPFSPATHRCNSNGIFAHSTDRSVNLPPRHRALHNLLRLPTTTHNDPNEHGRRNKRPIDADARRPPKKNKRFPSRKAAFQFGPLADVAFFTHLRLFPWLLFNFLCSHLLRLRDVNNDDKLETLIETLSTTFEGFHFPIKPVAWKLGKDEYNE